MTLIPAHDIETSWPFMPVRIHPTPQMGEAEGFQCLRNSNWIICSLFLAHLIFELFIPFQSHIGGGAINSYYPRADIGRG